MVMLESFDSDRLACAGIVTVHVYYVVFNAPEPLGPV